MKRLVLAILAAVALAACTTPTPAEADAVVGKPAPTFSVKDTNGKPVDLASLKGKYVVLEWWNYLCPVVQSHYDPGKMQAVQKQWAGRKDVVWIVVCSSAPGKQGAVSAAEANQILQKAKATPDHVVLDPSGSIGRAYGARTTPHMYVIDPKGTLIYNGAIDDKGSKNYVTAALTEAMAGKKVTTPVTQPYGCSVKYP